MNIKRIAIALITLLPLAASAQNVWEKPETEKEQTVTEVKQKKTKGKEKAKAEDVPYLKGAVNMVDGCVEWDTTINVPGKTASELYDEMMNYMTSLTKQSNQMEQSSVALVNKRDHIIVTRLQEWLVFKANFISLDRTEFNYTLVTTCRDNQVDVKMFRLNYKYNVDGKEETYKAKEWITDKYAVNKKNTRLLPITGKFRRKTIDRKSFLFNDIKEKLTK